MTNTFENYLKAGKVKKKTPDPSEASSLYKGAIARLKYAKQKEITKEISAFVLEDAYEAARKAAQSLMSKEGFKPYSHEATISFLREKYKIQFKEEELQDFERFRQLRSDSIYRAVEVSIEDAKNCVSFANKIINKIGKLI